MKPGTYTTPRAPIVLLVLLLHCSARSLSSQQPSCPQRGALKQGSLAQKSADDAVVDALIARMTPAERIAQMGDRAPALPRLGLPAYNWWNEGLHGIARNGYATVFPQAIGLAATWDSSLLHAVGDTVSTEARAKFNGRAAMGQGPAALDSPRYGGLTVWSPNINIFRDPRWGRGQETYGEDPFLTGSLGTQFVRGVQGDDADFRKVDATPKHFAAHSGPEQGRDSFHAQVSAHDLADTYLPAFHALLTTAGADALLCSYNGIDATPACANQELLTGRVRERWGFRGYIVSDCDAVGNLSTFQHFSVDAAHGAAAALHAGVDLDCGSSYDALNQALAQGLVSQSDIDRSLHRLLLARLRLGLLGTLQNLACSPFSSIGASAVDTAEDRVLALRAASESLVLLKNDGILPLDPKHVKLAVVGPDADSVKVLEANYHGTASAPVTPLEGLRRRFPNLRYAQGSMLAEGVAVPIPETAFGLTNRPDAAASAARGLHAEYFDHAGLTGTAAISATVRTIDLDLDRAGPAPQMKDPRFSARWTGYLIPPAAGDYTLQVQIERCWDCQPGSHDHFRLYVDGALLIDNTGSDEAEAHVDPDHSHDEGRTHEDGNHGPDQSKQVPADPVPSVPVRGRSQLDRALVHLSNTRPLPIRLELEHFGQDEGIVLAWVPPAAALLEEAVAATRDADAIVAFVGLSPDLEGEALKVEIPGFRGGDRTSLDLPAPQAALLQRLEAQGKPIIAVVCAGSAVALPPDRLSALLEAWYPGEQGGNAIAGVLSGDTSPAGRLPVTVYRSVEDLPAFTDYSMAHRTYRYATVPVLYGFGSGLSYSQFAYSGLEMPQQVLAGQDVTVHATVRNTGPRESDEVAQLYVLPPKVPGSPRITLEGFDRIHLKPGEEQRLTFTLGADQLSFVDPGGARAERAGDYEVFVGGGQPGTSATGVSASLKVVGSQARDF